MIVSKTDIEYGDYHWGFIMGCIGKDCAVKDQCWARAQANRFKETFGDFNEPKFLLEEFQKNFPDKPSRILVCFMSDIFGEGIDRQITYCVLERIIHYPQHDFIFLTKHPEEYSRFSFPTNCQLGTTVNTKTDLNRIMTLANLNTRNLRWVSFEPIMDDLLCPEISLMDWIVIGGWSARSKIKPKKEWIQKILDFADNNFIPVWLKGNLKNVMGGKLRQELPE